MTEVDLARIESELGITLPLEYRGLMLTRAEELAAVAERHQPFFAESLFLDPDDVIRFNQSEREADWSNMQDEAPEFAGWWNRFVLVGTNGAGDFF